MELQLLPQTFSVCKLTDLPSIGAQEPYCFLGVTDDEISLVCPLENVPVQTIAREDGWRGFRVRGTLDFSLIGVIASISSVLAEEGISIFALSTYNTDYVFLKDDALGRAAAALVNAGYCFV